MGQLSIFALLSSSVYLIGMVPYYRNVIKGKTLPHPYSYGVWTFVVGISSLVLFLKGEFLAFVPAAIFTILNASLFVYGISYRKRIPINYIDILLLLSALGTLLYGLVSRNYFNTIGLVIIIDFLALAPTIKKTWILPWSETLFSWVLTSMSNALLLFSITHNSFENIGFWSYNAGMAFFFFAMVGLRRFYLEGWKGTIN